MTNKKAKIEKELKGVEGEIERLTRELFIATDHRERLEEEIYQLQVKNREKVVDEYANDY